MIHDKGERQGRRLRVGGEVVALTSAEFKRIVGEMSGELERAEQALAKGMDEEYFDQRKSRTSTALDDALGPQLARPYRIQSSGRGTRRFGLLNIDPEAIRYGDLSQASAGSRARSIPS